MLIIGEGGIPGELHKNAKNPAFAGLSLLICGDF